MHLYLLFEMHSQYYLMVLQAFYWLSIYQYMSWIDKFSIQMETGCLILLYSSFSRPLQEKRYKIISFIFLKKKSVSSTGFIKKEIKEFYRTTTITDQARSLFGISLISGIQITTT